MRNIYLEKKNNDVNNTNIINNFSRTGYTISLNNPLLSNIITINNKNNDEIMRISPEGDVYYRFNDNMVKVEIPEDLAEAFLHTVMNYSGKDPDDIMIEKYLYKILNNKKSNEYMMKLEVAFRKIKLKKLDM